MWDAIRPIPRRISDSVCRHIQPGQVRYLEYHGLKRREAQQALSQHHDIVITTYETLRQDWLAGGGLYNERWYRLVLDEGECDLWRQEAHGVWLLTVRCSAHHIRNRSSQIFNAVTAVGAHFRWCLTGTPIQNSLDDYGALLSFIGVPVLRDKPAFDYWIATPMKEGRVGSLEKLRYLVAATAFRRTKATLETTVKLPAKIEKIESVKLSDADRELYEFFKAQASKTADQLSGSGQVVSTAPDKNKNTLALINLLRLICNHGEHLLPTSAANAWRTRQKERATDGMNADMESDAASTPEVLSQLPLCPSAKVKALLKNLREEQRTACVTVLGPVKR